MTSDIQVEVLPSLSSALGEKSKIVLTEKIGKEEKLKQLLERIAIKNDSFGAAIYDIKRGNIHNGVAIFVNNKSIENLEMKIKGGDRITVTPLYYGG